MNYFRIRENSFWARMAAQKLRSDTMAMVLGHTIHLHGVNKNEFLADTRWLRHELKHIEQYERYGTMGFVIRYLYQTMRNGYYNCGLECEARDAEGDEDIAKRFLYCSGRRI